MPPKRSHRQKNNKPLISGAGAMADCVLPQDIMFSIVTRLPVKSIHRFKAVCKPWCKLFATPKFMKTHHAQLSQNPENQSVIIYSWTKKYGGHTMSLVRIESGEQKPINLNHPYPKMIYPMDFVGSCNGLLCLAFPSYGQWIFVWNPALNVFKSLPLPKLDVEKSAKVSIGFGYDDESDDFKVVRIVSSVKERKGKKMSVGVGETGVEVYSCNSDSWKKIKVGFQFSVICTKQEAVVNGNPYWLGWDGDGNESGGGLLVWFDLRKMVLQKVSMKNFDFSKWDKASLVDWKGSIAILAWSKNGKRVLWLDVWVFNESGKIGWTKNRSFGPMELKVDRFLKCTLKNGEIFGECPDGKLFVLDLHNVENGGGGVKKEIVIDGAEKGSFQVRRYTESLAFFKGMAEEKVKTEEEEQEHEKKIDRIVDSLMLQAYLGVYEGVPMD